MRSGGVASLAGKAAISLRDVSGDLPQKSGGRRTQRRYSAELFWLMERASRLCVGDVEVGD